MIRKTDVIDQLDQQDVEELKSLEVEIDRALLKFDGGSVSVSVEGVSNKVIAMLKKKYRLEGGWTVNEDYGYHRDPYHVLIFN